MNPNTERAAEAFFNAVRGYFKRSLEPLTQRTAALEKLVRDLQADNERSLKFMGTWKHGIEYPAGSAVSHRGALWVSGVRTKSVEPGAGSLWTLAVKRGMVR